MKKNNLFLYATSELSQDAFICWLMNFAHKDHLSEDSALTDCAKELLSKIIKTGEELVVTCITKQYKNIDVLVQVNNKYNIIIEDKTFTSQHGNQINRYRKTLEDEGRKSIICVYYKIVEQAYEEKADLNIGRQDLLKIFSNYIDKTQNSIFKDYYEYLLSIDEDVNSYKNTKIEAWRRDYNHAYKGFFTHLIKDGIIQTDRGCNWDYVPNQSAGFWGLWWYFLKGEELDSCNLTEDYIEELYLQIEDNVIAVKMTGNTENASAVRWSLYDYFSSRIPGFKKKSFRKGKWMTVGYIEYNETNYKEKIQIVQNIMKSITNGEYKYHCTN